MKKKKAWYEYLWIASSLYLILGFFNIYFAWLGLLCFLIPLLISIFRGNKAYCNKYCGRGQLFELLGQRLKFSANRPVPRFLRSKWFRYGFLIFFLIMFGNMLFTTYLVGSNSQSLKEAVTLFWTFRLPWQFANPNFAVPAWIAQFAYGFYSLMLTSTLLGMLTMVFFRPRSWCVYCPMGTMTQLICKAKTPNSSFSPDSHKK